MTTYDEAIEKIEQHSQTDSIDFFTTSYILSILYDKPKEQIIDDLINQKQLQEADK